MGEGERADLYLVAHGFAETRAEAQAAIHAGRVRVNGDQIHKSSQLLRLGIKIQYDRAHPYVSRGGVKLAAALKHFGYSVKGSICLDIGASTGGFTQVLLQDGARRIYAVDVGHGQLNAKLLADSRIVSLEGVNARDLSAAPIGEPVDVVVADVSFISLRLVLPAGLSLASKDAWAVVLVKPQFEVGRGGIDKGGIVKSEAARMMALDGIAAWMTTQNWQVEGTIPSPITGADGNQEYLLAARRK